LRDKFCVIVLQAFDFFYGMTWSAHPVMLHRCLQFFLYSREFGITQGDVVTLEGDPQKFKAIINMQHLAALVQLQLEPGLQETGDILQRHAGLFFGMGEDDKVIGVPDQPVFLINTVMIQRIEVKI